MVLQEIFYLIGVSLRIQEVLFLIIPDMAIFLDAKTCEQTINLGFASFHD
jgi:hypothetical protein